MSFHNFTSVILVSFWVAGEWKIMELRLTPSPLALATFNWRTGTLRVPGIWVDGVGVLSPGPAATLGWLGVGVGVMVGLLVEVEVGVLVGVRVMVGVAVQPPMETLKLFTEAVSGFPSEPEVVAIPTE